MARRLWAALCVAFVAVSLAKGIGIPWWLDGWDYGDQADIGLMTFLAVWMLLKSEPHQ